MSVISDLYYGKGKPFGERSYDSPEYKKNFEKMLDMEKEILSLCPDCKELLDRYMEANMALNDIAAYESFERGFKFGARIVMEAMKPF